MSVKMIGFIVYGVIAQCCLVSTVPVIENQTPNNLKEKPLTTEVDEDVFTLPKTFNIGDEVYVNGSMKEDREKITISLVSAKGDVPDYANVACQVKLDFPTRSSSKDMITINTVVNGHFNEFDEDTKSTDMFLNLEFSVRFIIRKDENKEDIILVKLKESDTTRHCKLEYGLDNIKYITIGGDVHKVEKLEFQFG